MALHDNYDELKIAVEDYFENNGLPDDQLDAQQVRALLLWHILNTLRTS